MSTTDTEWEAGRRQRTLELVCAEMDRAGLTVADITAFRADEAVYTAAMAAREARFTARQDRARERMEATIARMRAQGRLPVFGQPPLAAVPDQPA